MYNRRVLKCHARVEAYGAVDELNAALGLAHAVARPDSFRRRLEAIQQHLVRLMGELATSVEDLPRYLKEGHLAVTPAMTASLDRWIGQIEAAKVARKGWVMPGANQLSAAFDFARTVCRRAERRVCALQEAGQLHNPEIIVYLNRLSDLLWLLARWTEGRRP
jgi:cob(I)alamin adenosyltransferase